MGSFPAARKLSGGHGMPYPYGTAEMGAELGRDGG
jgi:hypothetical protein